MNNIKTRLQELPLVLRFFVIVLAMALSPYIVIGIAIYFVGKWAFILLKYINVKMSKLDDSMKS